MQAVGKRIFDDRDGWLNQQLYGINDANRESYERCSHERLAGWRLKPGGQKDKWV